MLDSSSNTTTDTTPGTTSYTCFDGHRRIASGSLPEVALIVKQVTEADPLCSILIFNDTTGYRIDLDLQGSDEEVVNRLTPPTSSAVDNEHASDEHRGRGRPKLGVVAREVTLLPRHWDWLATQPGGASVALRKLIEEARRTGNDKDRKRHAHERAYRFMSAIAGNMPDFEEASRALFAHDRQRFTEYVSGWGDPGSYAIELAFGGDQSTTPDQN
ncbi:MAG TPA: DUF2239 family protein [Phototrophicaceae bacterium]|jgi:hypothetical protein|nr:DUF2239 family protein [Phototrophicaceae bacterium]